MEETNPPPPIITVLQEKDSEAYTEVIRNKCVARIIRCFLYIAVSLMESIID
jgi:hypothetical protein